MIELPAKTPVQLAPRSRARHALVTGGGTGIGAAVANLLEAQGMRVTLLGRSKKTLDSMVAQHPRTMFAVCADVTDAVQVREAFEASQSQFGVVDILINNAGLAESTPFLKMDEHLWSRALSVNLTGTMICTQAVVAGMLAQNWGRVVNIASTAGQVGYAYVAAYCAAKHGVIGLTKSLAKEFATKGITFNAVCPGYTDTELLRESIDRVVAKTGRTHEAALAHFVRSNPQGKLVQPRQVASVAAWLCEDDSASVTGQVISVSGGEV